MTSRAEVFKQRLPYPLGVMVEAAFIYSSRRGGLTDERIAHKLYLKDATYLMTEPMHEIIMGQLDWSITKEGHTFWLEIYNKLKQIEEQ